MTGCSSRPNGLAEHRRTYIRLSRLRRTRGSTCPSSSYAARSAGNVHWIVPTSRHELAARRHLFDVVCDGPEHGRQYPDREGRETGVGGSGCSGSLRVLSHSRLARTSMRCYHAGHTSGTWAGIRRSRARCGELGGRDHCRALLLAAYARRRDDNSRRPHAHRRWRADTRHAGSTWPGDSEWTYDWDTALFPDGPGYVIAEVENCAGATK